MRQFDSGRAGSWQDRAVMQVEIADIILCLQVGLARYQGVGLCHVVIGLLSLWSWYRAW